MSETDSLQNDDDAVVDMAAVRREARIQEWCDNLVRWFDFDYNIDLKSMPHLFWRLRLHVRSILELKDSGVKDLLPEDAEGAFLDYVFQTFGAREEFARLKYPQEGETPDECRVEEYLKLRLRHIESKLASGDAYDLNQEDDKRFEN